MRAALKLSAILLLTVAAQWAIVNFVGPLDEAAFHVRMFIAYMQGDKMDDQENVNDALRVMERQWKRRGFRPPSATQPTTQPLRLRSNHSAGDAAPLNPD